MMARLADVAQLARASACHAEGRGFESLHPLLEDPLEIAGFLASDWNPEDVLRARSQVLVRNHHPASGSPIRPH
jgi:hypothetical protein